MKQLTDDELAELKWYLASEFRHNYINMTAKEGTFFGVRVGLKAAITVCHKYNLTPDELCTILEDGVKPLLKG